MVVIGQGIPDQDRVPNALELDVREVASSRRQAYFGPETGWIETPVIGRQDVANGYTGPFIVEEYDATCIVPPGADARLDDYGSIHITLG